MFCLIKMTQEFENILRLIQGNEAQFELGMQLAIHYEAEFEDFFCCTIGEARNLFPFLFAGGVKALCRSSFTGLSRQTLE
jgi:hypothetical protein